MAEKDGGPAFPGVATECGACGHHHTRKDGLSLRDYFAAAALTGLLAKGDPEYQPGEGYRAVGKYIQDKAFKIADSMLAARESA